MTSAEIEWNSFNSRCCHVRDGRVRTLILSIARELALKSLECREKQQDKISEMPVPDRQQLSLQSSESKEG
jgi:hypothetical protein